jgi:hypothetical protein
MINTAGTITTMAGIPGSSGYSGDNGPALSANLNFPRGVYVNQISTVFIADRNNQRIREVTYGNISTIAGTGSPGYTEDGGLATSAQMRNPFAVSVDQIGRVFFADAQNNAIRMVNTDEIINTIAGTGSFGLSGDGGPATSAQLRNPLGVFVDQTGLECL